MTPTESLKQRGLSLEDIPTGPIDWTIPELSPDRLIALFGEQTCESPEIRTDIDVSTRRADVPILTPEQFGVVTYGENGKASLDKNALVDYLKTMRIVFDGQSTYIFDGCIYRPINKDDLERIIYTEVRRCYNSPFLSRTAVADVIAMLRVTSTWADVEVPEEFDSDGRYDGTLIPFQNGLYNTDTDELLPFTPFLFITRQLNIFYDPSVQHHDVESVYARILPDRDTREFFFQMVGFTLFSDVLAPSAIFLIYGPGNTGKSALQEAVITAAGRENVSTLDLAQLSGEFTAAELSGKIMNVCGETGSGQSMGVSKSDGELLKRLSDGQVVTLQRKYGQPFECRNTAKLWFVTNTLPDFGDTSSGLYRRLHIIPCRVAQRWEDQIYSKMQEETAITWLANQALRAYLRFIRDGRTFTESREMRRELSNYRIQEPLMDFLEDYFGTTDQVRVAKGLHDMEVRDLYDAYKVYTTDTGGKPLSQRRFAEKIRNEFRLVTEKTRSVQTNGRPTNVTRFVNPNQE